MKSWQPVSLPVWLKDLNVEMILISGFMNSEIRNTSILRYFCQTDRLPGFHFEKPLTRLTAFSNKFWTKILMLYYHLRVASKGKTTNKFTSRLLFDQLNFRKRLLFYCEQWKFSFILGGQNFNKNESGYGMYKVTNAVKH